MGQLAPDKTLSTDGQYCLDWTSAVDSSSHHAVYMNSCSASDHAHQRWHFTVDGYLTTEDANDLVLDWTSKSNSNGGHTVYMNTKKHDLPHQQWHLASTTLSSKGEDKLCLE